MFILDTDTLSHLLRGNPRVILKRTEATEDVVLTVITRIEILQGRFASVLKAADQAQLLLAHQHLRASERELEAYQILPITTAVATEFERLLHTKGLKKIGRGDLLIASIALANKATLVTRNTRDFLKVPGLQIENWAD